MSRFDLDFPRALGAPVCSATLKGEPEHFRVSEELGFELSGTGEHLYLKVAKRGVNTEEVARFLANRLSIRRRDVGFAGRKDRNAVTVQWFSCWLPGRHAPPAATLAGEGLEIVEVTRHRSKLKRGQLVGNRFDLLLTELPPGEEIRRALAERCRTIAASGVPNYFGEQRFGDRASNLAGAARMLEEGHSVRDRHLRGLYLSSARSYLFNLLLAARVGDGTWREGRQSAPLYGMGARLDPEEREVLAPWFTWCEALEKLQLRAEGRPLVMPVQELEFEFPSEGELRLRCLLGKGCYATALLREMVDGVLTGE